MSVIVNVYHGHEIQTVIEADGSHRFVMGGEEYETLAKAIALAKQNPITQELASVITA